jgi:hypothetical protein
VGGSFDVKNLLAYKYLVLYSVFLSGEKSPDLDHPF